MSSQNTKPTVSVLRRATAALPITFFVAYGAGAAPLDQEPPARMVPICFAHLDNAIATLRDGGSPPDDGSEQALYRGREVFRNWMSKHPANPAEPAPAPRNAAEMAEDMGFCRRIGAVMFQFAKPQESAEMIRKADAASAADAANRRKRQSGG